MDKDAEILAISYYEVLYRKISKLRSETKLYEFGFWFCFLFIVLILCFACFVIAYIACGFIENPMLDLIKSVAVILTAVDAIVLGVFLYFNEEMFEILLDNNCIRRKKYIELVLYSFLNNPSCLLGNNRYVKNKIEYFFENKLHIPRNDNSVKIQSDSLDLSKQKETKLTIDEIDKHIASIKESSDPSLETVDLLIGKFTEENKHYEEKKRRNVFVVYAVTMVTAFLEVGKSLCTFLIYLCFCIPEIKDGIKEMLSTIPKECFFNYGNLHSNSFISSLIMNAHALASTGDFLKTTISFVVSILMIIVLLVLILILKRRNKSKYYRHNINIRNFEYALLVLNTIKREKSEDNKNQKSLLKINEDLKKILESISDVAKYDQLKALLTEQNDLIKEMNLTISDASRFDPIKDLLIEHKALLEKVNFSLSDDIQNANVKDLLTKQTRLIEGINAKISDDSKYNQIENLLAEQNEKIQTSNTLLKNNKHRVSVRKIRH